MNPKLQSTKDYARFDLCQFNRSVAKKKHLLQSMKQHGFIPAYPIHCTHHGGRLQIKAGHHRFECAQELGLPVYYVISDDSATIHELEKATVKWTVNDYLESHIRCGREAYVILKNYQEATGIPLSACISIVGGESAGSCNKLEEFKEGRFVVRGEQHANEIGQVVIQCRSIGIDVNALFVNALSRCLRVKEFSAETFVTRASSNRHLFKKCRTLEEQMRLFEDVYNFKAHHQNKLALCFLADIAMKTRSCVQTKAAT